ncbi:MAG: hypothetical protein HOW71_05590 [Nonomuraea sp.]|nr:hypothetical protein [Nonomuraea sp.]NUP61634.1 hypothetical protein [Nonomuraea sp.]NUS04094.1 hypothetical protein [Nonomuraea sp.]
MKNDTEGPEAHPLLVKLLQEGNPDTMTLWGYVGPPKQDGFVTLYPSLEDLSSAIEIPSKDVLHMEDVPESILLFGAKVLWVRRDATVVRRQAGTAEESATAETVEDTSEIRAGRLHLRVKTERAGPHSPCATCRDCSSVCISSCRKKSLPE